MCVLCIHALLPRYYLYLVICASGLVIILWIIIIWTKWRISVFSQLLIIFSFTWYLTTGLIFIANNYQRVVFSRWMLFKVCVYSIRIYAIPIVNPLSWLTLLPMITMSCQWLCSNRLNVAMAVVFVQGSIVAIITMLSQLGKSHLMLLTSVIKLELVFLLLWL